MLAERVSVSHKFTLLSEKNLVSVVRLLTRHPSPPEGVYTSLSRTLRKTEDAACFFVAMDALASLAKNSAPHKNKGH